MEHAPPHKLGRHMVSGQDEQLAIEVFGHSDSIRELWQRFQSRAKGGPHQTWEWTELWLRCHPHRHSVTPQIVVARDRRGECIALLPLAIRQHLKCSVLEWLAADQGNYSSGFFEPEFWSRASAPDSHSFLASILEQLPPVDLVHLADQPDSLQGLRNPMAQLPGVLSASDGYVTDLGGDWRLTYEREFSAPYRREQRRAKRRLADHGGLHLECVTGAGQRRGAIEAILRQKEAWLAERGIPNFLSDDEIRSFYLALADAPEKGSGFGVQIFRLCAGEDMVAGSINVTFRDQFYGLMASTTQGPLRRYGPGRLLLTMAMEKLAATDFACFDLGAGEGDHKLRWATGRRRRSHAIVPVTAAGRLYALVLWAGLSAKSRVKHSPQLWQLISQVRRYRHRAALFLP